MAQDLSDLSGELYRHWEKSMTTWWDQVLESPAFLDAVNTNLGQQARGRKQWEDKVEHTMSAMHLPSRKDVVRIARIATLLEDKVLAVEDRLLEQGDQLDRIEKETLEGRLGAAEAMVALQDKLESLEAKIDALTSALADRPAPERRAARTSD
ncbi:MAG: hypothetical protein ACI8PZ_006258 [Myxococcota bacterium]|jgi:hypothetical protein